MGEQAILNEPFAKLEHEVLLRVAYVVHENPKYAQCWGCRIHPCRDNRVAGDKQIWTDHVRRQGQERGKKSDPDGELLLKTFIGKDRLLHQSQGWLKATEREVRRVAFGIRLFLGYAYFWD